MSYKISGPIKVSDLHAKRREIVGPRGGQRGPFSVREEGMRRSAGCIPDKSFVQMSSMCSVCLKFYFFH